MCAPVPMAALAIASTGVGVYAQREQAKAQTETVNAQAGREREETLERNEEELGERIRQARESRARARVAAGESGALGASFAASLNQSLQDQDNDVAMVQKNIAFSQRATNDRRDVALSQIRSPSALEAGLQIASAGVRGYDTGLSIKQRRAKGA